MFARAPTEIESRAARTSALPPAKGFFSAATMRRLSACGVPLCAPLYDEPRPVSVDGFLAEAGAGEGAASGAASVCEGARFRGKVTKGAIARFVCRGADFHARYPSCPRRESKFKKK